MTKVVLSLAIDWSNDLSFSDTGEDVSARVLNNPGVTFERGRDQIRALAPPMAGQASFDLLNTSKDYSPAYGASPLAGNLTPGRGVRIQLDGLPMWRGNVDDLPQHPWLRGGGTVSVPSLGTLARLKGATVSSKVYTNITTDVAFGHVCRLAGLTNYQALDTGKTTLTTWWAADSDAFAMLAQILAAEGPGAAIYENASGVITFHSRHYRLTTARCTTSQATFGNGTTEPKHSPPFGYQPNLKGVVNACSLTVKTATLASSDTTVWSWTGSVPIPPGESRSWYISTTDPFYNPAVTPGYDVGHVSATFTDEVGGGSPKSGAKMQVSLLNDSSPAVLVTVSSLGVVAKTYSSVSDTVVNSVDTSASIAKYKLRALPSSYSPWPYVDRAVMQDFADAIVTSYQEPRATVTVTVKNQNATRVTQQLTRDISDRITVQEDQTGLSGPAIIERIKHSVSEGGRVFTTEFGCETVGTQGAWFIMDTSVMDTGRVGY